ncbi:glycosyltransferase [Butyrivibrio sp. VCD2006]|uniref:glycosyltransferase n=1 Tax=Butyrivibrio sp. VCD2006 TaxID=1280664 RepID=UPI0004295DB0|nr:glycosyltransferase [Butyrivibrio sp. VCD2006]
MSKKVSIIVPVYNGEKYIDRCAKNLLAQTYENLEFIIVDDGSTDKTPEKCDYYASRDPRFVVVHKANGGLSSARNAGTDKATGDYVLYYDVDDDITESLVEDNIKLAESNDADVVMFCFWYFNVDTGEKKDNLVGKDFIGDKKQFFDSFLNTTIDHEVFNAPWNKMYKRSFLIDNSLRFLPEFPIYEDIIFASKMLQYAEKIVVNNNMYYSYYVRSSGSLITKYMDGYFASVTRFYKNAMDYCRMFADNDAQILKFSNLYVTLVNTNLKQISLRKELSFEEKKRTIRAICDEDIFRSAVRISRLERIRKVIIRQLVLTRNAAAIIRMYTFLEHINR